MRGSGTGTRVGWLRDVLAALLIPISISAAAIETVERGLGWSLPEVDAEDTERRRSVYDLSLHDSQDMQLLLERLEQLARRPNPQAQPAGIALVLHGPELEYFSIRNYPMHRALVDLAAKLDAFQVIEVKACDTKMRELGLRPEDMPAFIDIVPYGPDEVERLVREGYLKM